MTVSFSIYKPVQAIASMAALQILVVQLAVCSSAGAGCFGISTGLLAGLYSTVTGMSYTTYIASWFPPISATVTGLWIGKARSEMDTSELLKNRESIL